MALRVFCARVRYIRDNFHSLRSPSRSSSAPFAKYTRSLAIVPLTHNPDNSRLRKNVYTNRGTQYHDFEKKKSLSKKDYSYFCHVPIWIRIDA